MTSARRTPPDVLPAETRSKEKPNLFTSCLRFIFNTFLPGETRNAPALILTCSGRTLVSFERRQWRYHTCYRVRLVLCIECHCLAADPIQFTAICIHSRNKTPLLQ